MINSKKYKVLIITCWVVYIACFILKLCGANWFEVACSNENFVAICDYVDNTMWLKMTLTCLVSIVLNSLTVLAMLKEKFYTWKQALVFIPLIIGMSVVSWYQPYVQLALNITCLVIVPLLFKAKWYNVLIGNVLIVVFQLISMLTKNVSDFYLNNVHFLIELILQIDSAIMVTLYYLYSNSLVFKKKGDEK